MSAVAPSRVLDGFGSFVPPPSTARPVPTDFSGSATADHPPGFYGPPENILAVNTLAAADRLAPLDFSALTHASREIYRKNEPQDLRGPILLAALGLLLLDTLIVLYLGGGIARLMPRLARAAAAAVLIVSALALTVPRAGAEDLPNADVPRARRSKPSSPMSSPATAMSTSISKAGLSGLTLFLAQRTALEAGEPIGLDIGRDELAFYPLIYWPIVPERRAPTDADAQAHRFLHEARRHCPVRYPRRGLGTARRRRRHAQSGHARTAQDPVLARYPRTRAGAARSRSDQDVLSACATSPAASIPASSGSRLCRR